METFKFMPKDPRDILKESARRTKEAFTVMDQALRHALWQREVDSTRFALAVLVKEDYMDAARAYVQWRYDIFDDLLKVTSWDELNGQTVDEVEFFDPNLEAVWNDSLAHCQPWVDAYCERLSEQEHERRQP